MGEIALPSKSRLLVKRDGTDITKQIPLPVVLIDTREQLPYDFGNHRNWIGETVRTKLDAGDYSVAGMESLLALERKSLPDLLKTLFHSRELFLRECQRLTLYRWRALLIEATYEEIKSRYTGTFSSAHPNGVTGTLDALEARYGIPIIYTSKRRELAQEKAASWLSKHFTYWHLEETGRGRVLQSGDL